MWTVHKCTGGMCEACTRPLAGLHAWCTLGNVFCSPSCERDHDELQPGDTKRWPRLVNEPTEWNV
jgi:hypothetical protein